MIGQELGGRYELMERVGGGGMALVYKAHDTLLGRKVAVKILRQQFTNDEDFIKRFRREAQAAASLSHPNVVSIYDVGQDGDVHYIIMEYIEGTNLNDKIKQQAPLQIEEAVHIASQICDALDHAHHNQIIHRDIKPHNILIGKNGRVKVTDFGIARAAASTDITQTGAVLGSVHYFSPEHAKGVAQGAKSDLYSLGIVLYQMLTAKLPFLGDSPISVALKHLQEKVEEPRKVNPLIPQSVENIILRALRKNPDERYVSAKQMLNDLETCLLPERRNEPRLARSSEDEHDDERTLIIPAIRSNQTFEPVNDKESRRGGNGRWDNLEEEPRTRSLAWIKPVVWIVIILALLGAMWYSIGWIKGMLEVPEVEVPNVVGYPLNEAVAKLKEAGLTVVEPPEYRISDEYDKDIVMEQDKAGEMAKEKSPISIVVSSGPAMQTMDNYVGRDWDTDVKNVMVTLGNQGATYKVEPVESDAAAGTVVGQSPDAGTAVDLKKTQLIIRVSKGLGTVPMIGVTNMKQSVAESNLTQKGIPFEVVFEKEYAPRGYVFKQWPYEEGDMVDIEELKTPGKELKIYVSDGLPDDAAESFVPITVPPLAEGEVTQVVITVTDAMGDNIPKKEVEITETTSFTVTLVLSPRKNGVITITRNDRLYDTKTITYQDAVNAMNPDRDIDPSANTFDQDDPGEDESFMGLE